MGNSRSGWYRGHAPRCGDHAVIDTARESPLGWRFWAARSWHWHGRSYHAELRVDRTAGLTFATAGLTIDDAGRCGRNVDIERAGIVTVPVGYGGACGTGCGSMPGRQYRSILVGRSDLD
jgi:hypothetical protein